MRPEETKRFLEQELLHRRFQDKIGNKEKQMEREIMMLKKENSELKDEIRQFSEWYNLLARKYKELNTDYKRLEDAFYDVTSGR